MSRSFGSTCSSYEVILALDGQSTWASETQAAPEIIAEENTILGAGLVNLRTSSRLVADLRGSGNR